MCGYFHFSANGCLFYNFYCRHPCIWSCVFLLQGSILLIGEYISYHVLFVSSKMMQCKQHTNCLFLFCRYQFCRHANITLSNLAANLSISLLYELCVVMFQVIMLHVSSPMELQAYRIVVLI